jgi:cob(I)alamin adenosyltransferase
MGQEESVIELVLRTAQQQAEKILRSPATLRFLSNPRVQKTMLQAINLRAELRQRVTTQVEDFARNHNLVTREDVAKLRRTLREMESTLAQLRSDLDGANHRAEKAETEARSTTRKAERKLPARKKNPGGTATKAKPIRKSPARKKTSRSR